MKTPILLASMRMHLTATLIFLSCILAPTRSYGLESAVLERQWTGVREYQLPLSGERRAHNVSIRITEGKADPRRAMDVEIMIDGKALKNCEMHFQYLGGSGYPQIYMRADIDVPELTEGRLRLFLVAIPDDTTGQVVLAGTLCIDGVIPGTGPGESRNEIIDVRFRDSNKIEAQQDGADQPATAPESKSEGKDKPQPESKVAPR